MPVEFYAYAGDCTVTGRVELGGVRLSEVLERHDEIVVIDATLHGLDGQPLVQAETLTLLRDDIYAVEVHAPADAADPATSRRIHTVRHMLRFACGPYVIVGELHALPGTAPLRALLQRRSVVPLTSALVTFERGGQPEIRRPRVVVVNGTLIDTAAPARATDLGPEIAAWQSA